MGNLLGERESIVKARPVSVNMSAPTGNDQAERSDSLWFAPSLGAMRGSSSCTVSSMASTSRPGAVLTFCCCSGLRTILIRSGWFFFDMSVSRRGMGSVLGREGAMRRAGALAEAIEVASAGESARVFRSQSGVADRRRLEVKRLGLGHVFQPLSHKREIIERQAEVGMGGAEDTPLDRDRARERHKGESEGLAPGVEGSEAREGHGDLQLATHDATLQNCEPFSVQCLRLIEASPRLDDGRGRDEVGSEIGLVLVDVRADRDAASGENLRRLEAPTCVVDPA